ncbi:MAB_1171c family putative transporter [Streptomyces sp. NPDC014864]|uniref:MAB_1171c family putative transporter n=1 Tax=Streptomyces sp. NPDC014864 TaxID=3364924 RepID=UPI003700CD70
MTGGFSFYVTAALLLFACALKIPALLRRPHDVLLRLACLMLLLGAGIMFFAAPGTIPRVNRLAGVPNFSAPLVYSVMTAFSGASLLLFVHWRPAPPEQTRRASRLCAAVYAAAILAIVVLFRCGDAPVEQTTRFDMYYATTPYIGQMIVTYLVLHGAASVVTGVLSWRWSREVRGSLRGGLLMLAGAYLMHLCFDTSKLLGVAARWAGRDGDVLNDVAVVFALPAAVMGITGFVLPLAGPRVAEQVRAAADLWQLAPLWRELRRVAGPTAVRVSFEWWEIDFPMRLTGRKTAIYDALLAVAPYFDRDVRGRAYRAARDRGEDGTRAAATADAAMIAVAAERNRRAHRVSGPVPNTTDVEVAWRGRDLIAISRAMTAPAVEESRRRHRAPAESSPS